MRSNLFALGLAIVMGVEMLDVQQNMSEIDIAERAGFPLLKLEGKESSLAAIGYFKTAEQLSLKYNNRVK